MNLNPFNTPLPVIVMLRNTKLATVEQIVRDLPAFPLLGRMGADVSPTALSEAEQHKLASDHGETLWRRDGCWREDGQKCDLDIIGVIIGRNAEGTLVYEPLAAAAGKKKAA